MSSNIIHIYIYTHIYLFICLYRYTDIQSYITQFSALFLCVYTHKHIYIQIYIYMHIYICTSKCMYICTCICLRRCICIYIQYVCVWGCSNVYDTREYCSDSWFLQYHILNLVVVWFMGFMMFTIFRQRLSIGQAVIYCSIFRYTILYETFLYYTILCQT